MTLGLRTLPAMLKGGKGGKSGPALKSGDADGSEQYVRKRMKELD